MRNLTIAGTGIYVPAQRVSAEAIDDRLSIERGWTARHTGVLHRHFVAVGELTSRMAAQAAHNALKAAGLTPKDLDVIVCASAVPQQAIPCTATYVQRELGLEHSGIPAFDVNSTCVSFVTGLDLLAYGIAEGRYKNALLVSADIASVALNWQDPESAGLFGDGAAAAILTAGRYPQQGVLTARQETYSSGVENCELVPGGSRLHPRHYTPQREAEFCFHMDGTRVFKEATRLLPAFVDRTLEPVGLRLGDIDVVVPHQASLPALRIAQRRLGIDADKFVTTVSKYGNCVAASIPMALHEAIAQERLLRGHKVMLLGTAAGMNLAAIVLEY